MFTLAILHGVILLKWPVWPVIAVGLWWNSNTISHNFIHRPFFRSRWRNRVFSGYLSALLGIPQSLWRGMHLAHHAGRAWRGRITPQIAAETGLIIAVWVAIALRAPHFFLSVYVPGYAAGLALCAMQGHYEHLRGVVSHYGTVYNFLCFNDGYHAEHHAYPGVRWSDLPARKLAGIRVSSLPAPLRWLESFSLEALERMVLRSRWLQRFVLSCHRRALAQLLPPDAGRVVIVGGGLYPRTALLVRDLLPGASIRVIEAQAGHAELARRFLADVEFDIRRYAGEALDCDVAIIPLSLERRTDLYHHPPAPVTLIHDWMWRRRGRSSVVSWLFLKRVNRV